jgi:peptidyl-prolyl cis-trans isomerase B (cyclophilin B)
MRRKLSHETSVERARISFARSLSKAGMLAAALLLAACDRGEVPSSDPATPSAAEFVWPSGPRPIVVLEIEGRGPIAIELFPELAPKTVANFMALAEQDFYDGTTFHRVVPGFMIQGGDPNSRDRDPHNDGFGGPGHTIPDEINAAPHVRGAVSMAKTGSANSGGSQFFIALQDAPQLDGKYSLFGRVIDGMAIVDAISTVEVDEHGRWGRPDRPLENVVIRDVVIRDGMIGDGVVEPAGDMAATGGSRGEPPAR